MKKIIIILTLFSIILFPIKSFADLVGKKVYCPKLTYDDEDGYVYDGQGSDGFEFLANNMLSYYEFRPTEKFHKNRPELIFPIKYLGVAFWPEANYEEESKKIIIYFVNHRDKGFTARKILNRETLKFYRDYINMADPLGPRIVEELGECQIAESNSDFDSQFKNLSGRYSKWLEEQKNKEKSKNKL